MTGKQAARTHINQELHQIHLLYLILNGLTAFPTDLNVMDVGSKLGDTKVWLLSGILLLLG